MTRWIVGCAAFGLALSLAAQTHAVPPRTQPAAKTGAGAKPKAGKVAPTKPAPGKSAPNKSAPGLPKPPATKPQPAKPAPAKPTPAKPDAPPPPPADPTAAAKKVFADRLCASCHTVRSAGISRQPPPPGPDLSEIGRSMDAAALDGWLRKGERRGGKPHAIRFLGDEAEWQVLVAWLVSLK